MTDRVAYLSPPSKPRNSAPDLNFYNAALLAVAVIAAPFVQNSYPAVAKPPIAQVGSVGLNLNLYTNPVPFAQTSFPSVTKPPASQIGSVGLNLNIYTNPIPFGPFDWSKPVASPRFAPDASRQLNTNLFTNPIPFAQLDWSREFDVPSLPPQAVPYNNNLFSSVAATAPFYTQDFSAPRLVPDFLPSLQYPNITLLNSSTPFYTQDFSKPFFPLVRTDASQQLNPNLFTNPLPFAQYDWSKPVRLQGALYPAPQPYSQLLFTNPIPFNQQDWSKPQAVSDWQPAISWQPSLSLTTTPVAPPFIPVDYNRSFRVPGLPPGSGPLNLNLYQNAIPFGPFDWSKPIRLQGALYAAPQPYNQKLYTNPIPFAQFDWSKPARLAGLPPQATPYSNNLFTATFVAAPFAQYDWSKPARTAALAPQAVSVNHSLYAVSSTLQATRRPLYLRATTRPGSYWRGITSVQGITAQDVLLSESGIAIITEDGSNIETEN